MGDRELSFEASGALLNASLVLRDRETDSWWSIMSSDAIGGELEGTDLIELPISETATWADWRRRHPETRVLSVGDREHVERDPYAAYFASEKTFRNVEVADRRLRPKTPIYAFHHAGGAWAAAHEAFEGGRIFTHEELDGESVLLYRPEGATLRTSSFGWRLPAEVAAAAEPGELARRLLAGEGPDGAQALGGFDTFWYNWIAVNEDSNLLRR